MLIVGDPAVILVDGLAAELPRRYDLPGGSVQLYWLKPNELLMVFPSEAEAVRVYNEGRLIHLPHLTLHCRCWSRFKNATGVTLPQLVDVEVRGVLAHVWELEIAEHLLDERCWVRVFNPDTVDRRDYSTFRLSAWCLNLEMIPLATDLIAVEPPTTAEEVPSPEARAVLQYQHLCAAGCW